MAGKELTRVAAFGNTLQKQVENFAQLMPREMVGRFIHGVLTLMNDHPELQRCSDRSLLMVCRRAAEDGLMLDGHEAAAVPFKDGAETKAQYIPMVLGIRKKVRASGEVSDFTAQVVFENDEFDYALGSNPYIHHKPSMSGGQSRPIVAAYSIATFKDGTKSYEIVN